MGNDKIREYKFILDSDDNAIPEPDVTRWAMWFETHTQDRIIARTTIRPDEVVSTVFLGLDHSFQSKGPPLLWETMVFGGPLDHEQRRYNSRQAALKGHKIMCQRVKRRKKPS